ncbi:unnamed protein product [Adineta steineri]|uniref:Tectonic domain-containing protein n=1 Tax=Adineta steineri TaxID=433720 RepID=A0A819LVB9_9BILA|nr:unnamed protein product [Adineta steineri]
MKIQTYILIYLIAIVQLYSNVALAQRSFANPAVSDPAPCACDLQPNTCDPNCCCDTNCDSSDLSASPVCNSVRTTTSYSSAVDESLQTWNCSNSTSAALYDYFPFVCVQLKLTEVNGKYYSTDNVSFITTPTDATNLRLNFVSENPELFLTTTTTTSATPTFSGKYIMSAPVYQNTTAVFTLPGNLGGSNCQQNVNVLFGVNRDVSCTTITSSQLCSSINSVTSILSGTGSSSSVTLSSFTSNYVSNSSTSTSSTAEYYFQNQYSSTIANIPYTNGTINDYCLGYYPSTRTQRYLFICAASNSSTSCVSSPSYQTWTGCPLRDNLTYSTIPPTFFTARATSKDSSTGFSDFSSATTASLPLSCASNFIRRVYYRFSYSSVDNTIQAASVYVQYQSTASTSPRITIEWIDISNSTSSTDIPRGYLNGEALQFLHNNVSSDVSVFVPTSSGLCVDATRQILRYKQSVSSYCSIQLKESTIQQCHDLKLNMYLYLNIFFAPASDVITYPGGTTTVTIRNATQDSLDLDRIDVTRANDRLDPVTIEETSVQSTPTIYDTTANLPVCYDVPSGIYIEFGYVRITVNSTFSYERIISVQYSYVYSNWQFDCTASTCDGTSTQKYLVSFQSAFVDYTNRALNLSDTTRADITSADNYIQHLLWLITSEYKGEPGYRNYTIAMILIFIAVSIIVIHILLFGIMFPF